TGQFADDFMNVAGATAMTLDVTSITKKTWFRAVVLDSSTGNGTCPGGDCELPSNVIEVEPGPKVFAYAIQPTCLDDVPQSDGYIQLSLVEGGLSYSLNIGSSFDGTGTRTSLSSATYPLQIETGLSNPAMDQDYNLRVYVEDVGGGTDCYIDNVVTLKVQDCTVGCECTEYIYLNEPNADATLKFAINTDGSVTEILNPVTGGYWAQNLTVGPHGLGTDVNGFLYIGNAEYVDNPTAGTIPNDVRLGESGVDKYDCKGNLIEEDFLPPALGDGMSGGSGLQTNIYSLGNTLYMNSWRGTGYNDATVFAYDICSRELIGTYTVCDMTDAYRETWDFHIDEPNNRIIINNYQSRGIAIGDLDANLNGPCIPVEFGTTNLHRNGITLDPEGNFYVRDFSSLYKYDSDFNLVYGPINLGLTGGSNAWGIVYSETTGLLYLAGNDADCISVYDPADGSYIMQAVVNPPNAGDNKSIAINTECCPTNNNITIDTVLTCSEVSLGDQIFLQDLVSCEGTICEGGNWIEGVGNQGVSFDDCDNSITITALEGGCSSFTLESDGLGGGQCGAFKITVNVCIEFCDISGTVFLDTEPKDEVVNGTGMGIINGEQIYAYLIDDAADTIVAEVAVAADGTYSFMNLPGGVAYDVEISTEDLAVGDPQPNPNTYPAGHDLTGEFDPEDSTFDSSPGGNVDLDPLTADITGVDFGISSTAIDISGTVFLDTDGDVNTVSGTGIGMASGVQLYVHLIDDSEDTLVVDAVPVNADGTFTFQDVDGSDSYDVVLSTLNLSAGDAENTNVGLPYGWGLVSENDPEDAPDPTPDGNVDLSSSFCDIMEVNFGINQGFMKAPCQAGYSEIAFDWSNLVTGTGQVWNADDASNVYTINYTDNLGNPATIEVTVNLIDPDNLNGDSDVYDASTHPFDPAGGCGATGSIEDPWDSDCNPVITETQGDGRLTQGLLTEDHTQQVSFEFIFSEPVTMAGYVVTDIDADGLTADLDDLVTEQPGDSYQDEAIFTAFDRNGDPVTVTLATGSFSEVSIVGNTALGNYVIDEDNNVDPDALAGQVAASTVSLITRFVQTYSNGQADADAEQANPNEYAWWSDINGATNGISDDQRISVSSFCLCVEDVNTAAIGNYVWIDENSDGLQDAGEPGLPNIKVILKDENGDPIDSTYTDANGGYLFYNLPEGTYFVDIDEETLPEGMSQTDPTLDDAIIPVGGDFGNQDHSGDGYEIMLGEGEENLTADFGYNHNPDTDVNDPNMVNATLGDRVWIDSDGEGDQDPNEIGVEGAIITLFGDPDGDGIFQEIGKDTTDANGNYLFDDLVPGAYFTQVTGTTDDASHDILDTNDYTQTGDPDDFGIPATMADNQQTDPVVLGPGDVFLNADYGYQPTPANMEVGSIGNTIWLDADADGSGPAGVNGDPSNGNGAEDDSEEEPIAGVSVALIEDTNENGIWDEGEPIIATDVTDENGQYLFDGLPVDDGGSDGDADYLVWVNDTDNVLDGLDNTYDVDGNSTDMDANGLGDTGSQVGGLSAAMISSGNPDATNQDFGYTPAGHEEDKGYIGNYVWFDVDGDDPNGQDDAEADGDSGIEGVVMELLDDAGEVIATTETDENGFYLFGGLKVDADGEQYQVRVASENFDEGGVLAGFANSYDPDDMTSSPNNEGALITLFTDMGNGENGNLDQDFGYTNGGGTDGMIGNQIWEDTDADGVYEPGDGEMGIEGVTIDLYADLNGNGVVDPGEPIIASTVTDANGQYQFIGLPVDDENGEDVPYIVDVTDEAGVLNGYWHSEGTPNADNNSQTDPYAVTLSDSAPSDETADFGYYVRPAALGNYVWIDTNGDGIQNDGETGLNGVEVTLDIEYPDGTTVTVVTTTKDDVDGNPGFYEFPNLLLDEDYAMGAGMNGGDPSATSPSAGSPEYVVSVDPNQMVFTDNNYTPTITDQTLVGGNDFNDSDDFDGVVGTPVQGNQNTDPNDDPTMEDPVASLDFGVVAELDLATILQVTSTTPTQGFYDDNDPITFTSTTTNQGEIPVSDLTITNYLPTELENPALVASSLMINGMMPPAGVTISMMGNDYVIDFGTNPDNWLQPDDIVIFEMTADITNGTSTSTPIVNTTEISSYDSDDNAATTPPVDVDSTPDSTNGNGSPGAGNGQGETDGGNLVDDETGEDGKNGGDEDDHDIAPVPSDVVLPVELLGFEAKADKDHIDLVWATASEYNNSHFELERSEDGKVFKQIARIEGQGTTIEQFDYDYEDQEVIPGVLYYYRLKQVDIDGVFEYSEIRSAQIEVIGGEMELYPNPIGESTELQVRFYTTELTKEFVIMDIYSRSVLQV
ncbi:MAG: SdrD B-like domain-containing protein, partial [Bacteroidota bacterium]